MVQLLSQIYTRYKSVLLLLLLLLLGWFGIGAGWNKADSDFPNYYVSAQLLINAELQEAYNVDLFNKHIQNYNKEASGLFVMYPPTTALIALPLTGMDLLTAKRIWILISLGAGIGIVILLKKLYAFDKVDAANMLLLAGFNLYNDIMLGQVYLFMLFLLLSGWYYFIKQHKFTAGFVWGVMAAIKFLPLFFIPFLWLKKQYKILLVLVLSFILIHCLTMDIAGITTYKSFINVFTSNYLGGQVANVKAFSVQYQSMEVFANLLSHNYLCPFWLIIFIKVGWKCLWFSIAFVTCKKHVGSGNFLSVSIATAILVLLLFENGSASYHLLFCMFSLIIFLNLVKNKQCKIALLLSFSAMGFIPVLINFFEPENLLLMFARLWCLSLFSLCFFMGIYKQEKFPD